MTRTDPRLPLLTLRLFGPFDGQVNGTALPHRHTRKGHRLLALLTLRAGCVVERSWLAGTLWPDSLQCDAQRSLRTSLHALRGALGSAAAVLRAPTPTTLCLELHGLAADLVAFDTAIARGDPEALERAITHYRGPLLEGWEDEWVFPERHSREEAYLCALERLAAHAMAGGDPRLAESRLRAVVAVDPLRENAHHSLMLALAAGGNHAEALEVYEELRLRLRRELSVEPDPDTTALYRRLQAEARSGLIRARKHPLPARQRKEATLSLPAQEKGSARRHNLPVPSTPLIGREAEVATARELLSQDTVRLLTLTGPGGSGKTRLGLQVAADQAGEFEHSVFFVPLAPLSDPDTVLPTIAQVLGVRQSGDTPLLDSVKTYLEARQLLLVLDNFEHLLAAAPLLADLLAAAPRLKLLVTSRAALHLHGEQEFMVPPLPVPDPKRLLPFPALMQYAAVELFRQRAVNVRPDFQLTPATITAVAEICYRLDGLPLAIELAAAWIRLLSPPALLARLERRLELLTGGPRDLPVRQQTLRNTIAWSYELLSEGEKQLFRRLSVFVGGCTLEAAAAVCQPGNGSSEEYPSLELEVLEGIGALVEKSLLRPEEGCDGEPRFSMLETVREYGRECLAAIGEAARALHQHLHYYLSLAQRADVTGPDQQLWFERLERDHGNFRAALDWSMGHAEANAGPQLAAALARFWEFRGHLREGLRWLTQALAHPQAAEPTVFRAGLLNRAGTIGAQFGDPAACSRLEESLEIWRALGDRNGMASVLHNMAVILGARGKYAQARAMFEEALTIGREQGNRVREACTLLWFGLFLVGQGEDEAARSLFQDSLRMHRELGDAHHQAVTLRGLGVVALRAGDTDAAQALFEEALALHRSHGTRGYEAATLSCLATVAMQRADYPTARALLARALAMFQETGQLGAVANLLRPFGRLALLQGQAGKAALLFGAMARVLLPPADRAEHDRAIAAARAALGEPAFAAAWATGRAMSLEQVIAENLPDT